MTTDNAMTDETSNASNPRIYVACLASYNDGILHGAWINADQTSEEIAEEIYQRVLRTSPRPNVLMRDFRCDSCGVEFHRQANGSAAMESGNAAAWIPKCPECDDAADVRATSDVYPASEEYAIHDHENFEGYSVGEYESLDDVARAAALISEHGEVFAKLAAHHGGDLDYAEKQMTEGYNGAFQSLEDWAESYMDDTGMFDGVNDTIKRYFDFAAFARDCELGGDIMTIETDDGMTHVFNNNF